jgi:hypothetical protein
VFTADRAREVVALIRPPFTALFLYGSHARGDAEESSDIDILQVAPTHTAPYTIGQVNVTCYTSDQLLRLARRGGLFARHLVEEASPLVDPQGVLAAIKSAYVRPAGYLEFRSDVRRCAPLLDVSESQFVENTGGLSLLVSYLIRTYLYAMAFDNGARSFAMEHVLDILGQHQARVILSNVRSQCSFLAFTVARTLFEELTGTTCQREELSLEAFIVNASANSELVMILGLRLLARGRPFTYDALLDVEF